MFSEGIPGDKLIFGIESAYGQAGLEDALVKIRNGAIATDLEIVDISFIAPSGTGTVYVVGVYKSK